jgi:hypothetical protein
MREERIRGELKARRSEVREMMVERSNSERDVVVETAKRTHPVERLKRSLVQLIAES